MAFAKVGVRALLEIGAGSRAAAADFHVSPAGNDRKAGSDEKPFASIFLSRGPHVGPSLHHIVIETGEPRPGDADYARALAARLTRERTRDRATATLPNISIPKN